MTTALFNPETVTLIGVSGKMGAGKDTTANYLINRFNALRINHTDLIWGRHAFADRIKATVATMVGADVFSFYTEEGKNVCYPAWNNKSGRELLQDVGTMMRERYDQNVWVRTTLEHFDPKKCRWIISDVRRLNEAEEIKRLGGIIIRLEGDPSGLRTRATPDKQNHISETELDDYAFDAVIENNQLGVEDHLYKKINLLFGLEDVPRFIKRQHRLDY